jgi:hypothetical protein
MFNCTLIGKWLWRYVHEREACWRVVVDNKFGMDGVLMVLLGHMGWGYRRILKGVGGSFLVIQNLR